MRVSQAVMELKGEMSMLNVLHLHSTNLSEIVKQLENKRDEVPAFFQNSPVIVDCSEVSDALGSLDLAALKTAISELSFVPVGIRGMEPEQQASVMKAGWPALRSVAKKKTPAKTETDASEATADHKADDPASEPKHAPTTTTTGNTTEVFDKPVRSGQQVFVDSGDAVLLTHTSAGSEVMASGSVHVYGAIRGRVLAGVHRDVTARIFC